MRAFGASVGLVCLIVVAGCGQDGAGRAEASTAGGGAAPSMSGASAMGGGVQQGGTSGLGGAAGAQGGTVQGGTAQGGTAQGGTAQGGAGGGQVTAARPNIIMMLVDDLGWGDLGVFYQNARQGTQKFATPKLDAFAAEGLQLRRHYTPAPVCAPARASLLLGVTQGHSNIRDNQFDQELDNNHTLATVLKTAGYATANIGKWGLQGPGVPSAQPSRPGLRGFDYFFGYVSHQSAHNHYPEQLTGMDNQGQPNAFLEGTTNITSSLKNCYSTDLLTARAKKWIADQRKTKPEQPFFLYLAYTAPHARLQVPTTSHLTPTSNYPEGGGLNGGVQWLGTPDKMINTAAGNIDAGIHPDYAGKAWPEFAKRHASMVRRLDDAIADLVQLLKDLSIDEQTLIVFTSDNGTHAEGGTGGDVVYDPTFFRSFGPFEGIKRDVLEGGMRVPGLVRWPGHVPPARVNDAPSQFQDWMPTFAELAGVPAPARSDGVSLVPLLTGQGVQTESKVYVEYFFNSSKTPSYAEFVTHAGQVRNQMQVVFVGGYKAERTGIMGPSDPFHIYDTRQDPAEAVDLIGKPGMPTQAELEARVTQLRRTNANAARPYDARPVAPAVAAGLKNGLDFRAYELAAPWVPNWAALKPVAEDATTGLDLSKRSRDADIGVELRGYLEVPTAGTYTFFLTTDTGAFVRLHDAQLIDADFGYAAGSEASSGAISLAAGRHPIRIHYRHGTGAQHTLSMSWQGPGISKAPIPDSAWFH